MAAFEVVWKRSAEKELRSLPREVIARMVAIAEGLANEPRPPGAKEMNKYEWDTLNNLQLGKYAEYFVKMELLLFGLNIYTPEVDDHRVGTVRSGQEEGRG